MREKILLAPGLNGNELIRSLALRGVSSIGLRICSAAELARTALMRSGISIRETFVSAREEAAFVAKAVQKEPYFRHASYSDILEVTACIRRMRCFAVGNDEAKYLEKCLSEGIFKDKNEAIFRVYHGYMCALAEENSVDAVTLIRRAADRAEKLSADFFVLKEFPLSPLEEVLLENISEGEVKRTSIRELFGVENRPLSVWSFKNCYGAPNEVETILTDIYGGKRIDQCTVAVTDAVTYGQLFFDYALIYEIPITFGCGIPVINSNPARLLSLYYRWLTEGFFGADAIGQILCSPAFDRKKLFDQFPDRVEGFHWKTFYKVLGTLRLTNDRGTNENRIEEFKKSVEEEAVRACGEKSGVDNDPMGDSKSYRDILRKQLCIPHLEVMARELSLPAEEFIEKYAYIRKGNATGAEQMLMKLDFSAVKAVCEELRIMRSSGQEQAVEDLISNVLKMTVCAGGSEPGKLHVTGIEGAFGTLRSNLYVAGLSASNYPGSPKENYLLLDADIRLFGPGAESFTSDGRVLRKREQLLSLVRLASALGINISVSYAGMNVSELKKDNASSLIFELFREEHGSRAGTRELEEHITKVAYFEPAVSVSRMTGDAYVKGLQIRQQKKETPDEVPVPWTTQGKAWSPSALDAFFSCPRRFMFKYLLCIPEPEEQDPFEVISPLDMGNLAHSLMQELGRSSYSIDAFLKLSGESFDRFIASHPPLIVERVLPVREQFLSMMETAYQMDPHREVVLEEEDIRCVHESGVEIHGYPDRVEKLEDGTYLIVDFKSGGKNNHEQDDISTCLQVVIYACLMEQKGFPVSGGEYRYLRLGETVTCRYDEDMKQQLNERLVHFRECLERGDFPVAETSGDNEKPCQYCRYKMFCGKSSLELAEEKKEGAEI